MTSELYNTLRSELASLAHSLCTRNIDYTIDNKNTIERMHILANHVTLSIS